MPVDVGVVLPEAMAPGMALPDVPGLAQLAERAGLDCLWSGDRRAAGQMGVLDSGLTLAAAGAVTGRLALGFAVYVPSLRPLAWAVKQIASLQHLAGGRLRLGVGLGGGPEQGYRATGFNRADRARRTDDFLQLLAGMLGGQPALIPDVPGACAVSLRPAVPGRRYGSAGNHRPSCGAPYVWGAAGCRACSPLEFAASTRRLYELSDQAGRP